jgi:hypothetical protein
VTVEINRYETPTKPNNSRRQITATMKTATSTNMRGIGEFVRAILSESPFVTN